MSKLSVLAAALLALLAIAHASPFRTTITIEEDNPRPGQSCQERIENQWRQLLHCAMYMSPSQSLYGPSSSSLKMVTNPRQQEGRQEHLQQCCVQLHHMPGECWCEAASQMLRHAQKEQGQVRPEQMREMEQRARYLPRACNLGPQECEIQSVFFF